MPAAHLETVLRHLRRLVQAERAADLTDAELLTRFLDSREEAAFTLLLQRHGPMVLSVCRRILQNREATEDAFQATFVVLARRAGSVRRRASLASWLYGVALRVARRAWVQTSARSHHERQAAMVKRELEQEPTWEDLRDLLDEEIAALPEKFRAPLVLHYLEGKTQVRVAGELRCPRSTVRDRLAQGRELLRERLVRRGVALSTGTLAAALIEQAAPAAVPACLTLAAVRAVMTGKLSVPAAAIVQEIVHVMGMAKLKGLACVVVTLGIVAGGTISAAHQFLPGGSGQEKPSARGTVPLPVPPKATARTDVYGDPLPDGAISRMGSSRLVHNMAHSLAFSRDGKVLATGGISEIRLWDRATGKLLREFREGKRTMNCIPEFSPDGTRLAGAGMYMTSIWDLASGELVYEFPHNGQMAAWSADGESLAITSKDGVVHVHETRTRKQVTELHEAKASLKNVMGTCIAFTADGKNLVTVAGRKAYRWDLVQQKLIHALDLPAGYSWFHSFPDQQTAVVSPADRRGPPQPGDPREPFAIWDMTSNQAPRKLQGDLARKGSHFAVSHDGKTIALNTTSIWDHAEEDVIGLWDAQSGELRRTFRIPTWFSGPEFSPDDRTLVTMGPVIRLWDVETGKEVFEGPKHFAAVLSLAFTPDGKSLVSGSLDRSVRLWDVASGRHVRQLAGHRWRCDVVAVTPDGKSILSGGYDGCLRLQDRDGKTLRRILLDGPPEKQEKQGCGFSAVAIAPDGKTAVACCLDIKGGPAKYQVWDLTTGKQLISRPDTTSSFGNPQPEFSSDARLVLEDLPTKPTDETYGAINTGALLREVTSGKEILRLTDPNGGDYRRLALAPDGRTVAMRAQREKKAGSNKRYEEKLHFWEVATRKERLTISYGPMRHWIQMVAYAPNGRIMAITRSDGTIRFWDLATGMELPCRFAADPAAHDSLRDQIDCLGFSADSRLLATGRRDGTILVWKVPPRHVKANAGQLEQWWSDLASDDARRAYRAICELSDQPEVAALFRDRLKPASEGPREPIRKLIADLDSPEFARRDAAKKELIALDEQAAPALREALKGQLSEEQRRRIEQLLSALDVVRSPERLRHLRALEVLERMATPDAERVIRDLAAGLPEARVTRDAKATLERLAMRSAWR